MVSQATDVQGVQRSARHFERWQSAQGLLASGRPRAALSSYHGLVRTFPRVSQLWFELGVAASGSLDFPIAETAFERAEELAPRDAPMLVLIGQQYTRMRRVDRARTCFVHAAQAAPESPHALLSLAAWWEREGRLEAAAECLEACLAQYPQDGHALCLQALIWHRQGRDSEAETLLRDLLRKGSQESAVRFACRHQLAVVLDALGNYGEAMRWLLDAKSILRQSTQVARMERDYDAADQCRRELLAGLTSADIARWRRETPALSEPFQLALLAGHPRSGTTLIERLLGAHPDLRASDECEAFAAEVWNRLAPMKAAQPLTAAGLRTLPADLRENCLDRYFRGLKHQFQPAPNARVVLDKNPSLTGALHLWLRLLPASKVLVALRDPRDVLLSTFFQNLPLTPTSANFLSLARTVRHYGDLMDTWLRLRDLGGFDWLETRYEAVVSGVETEGRRLTAFLGLEWHPSQAAAAQAPARDFVFSPTYSEVAKPVHRRALGRWRNYAEFLAPVQAALAPYCRAFGYADDSGV